MTDIKELKGNFRIRKVHKYKVYFILALTALVLILSFLVLGEEIYSPKVIWQVLSGHDVKGASYIIKNIRIPRLLAGILAGFSLGMAGNCFQVMLKNPLASPDVLGVTSSSSLAGLVGILVLGLNSFKTSLLSIVFSLLVAIILYRLSTSASYSSNVMILVGVGIRFSLSSLMSFIMLRINEYDLQNATRWLNGSLNGVRLDQIPSQAVATIVLSVLLISQERALEILELGDDKAVSLGVDVSLLRRFLIIVSVALIAFTTSVTGPISGVSFLAGPIAKTLVGQSDLLASGLTGLVIVLLSDLLGQFSFSNRYPVGLVTGVLGGFYLVYLIINQARKEG